MAYALLVRDVRADATIRHRLDRILAGEILPEPDSFTPPSTAPIDPEEARQRMEELRDSWGATPQAAQGKNAIDQILGRYT